MSQPAAGCLDPVLERALRAQRHSWPDHPLETGACGRPGWRRAEAFFADRSAIEAMLAAQGLAMPGLDRKGRAAFAIGDYAYALAARLVPLFVGFRLVPDFSAAALAVAVEPAISGASRGRFRFALSNADFATDDASGSEGCVWEPDALCDLMRRRIEEHFRPLIEGLHERTRLGRGALWRLVGDYFAQLFLDAGDRFGMPLCAKRDAMTILKHPGSPLSNRQLHYFDVAVDGGDGKAGKTVTLRARGGCCRQYTVAGCDLCDTCVLQGAEARRTRAARNLCAPAC